MDWFGAPGPSARYRVKRDQLVCTCTANGRAAVVADELAELELARQEPQRIRDLGDQADVEVRRLRVRLDACPLREAHRCTTSLTRVADTMSALQSSPAVSSATGVVLPTLSRR